MTAQIPTHVYMHRAEVINLLTMHISYLEAHASDEIVMRDKAHKEMADHKAAHPNATWLSMSSAAYPETYTGGTIKGLRSELESYKSQALEVVPVLRYLHIQLMKVKTGYFAARRNIDMGRADQNDEMLVSMYAWN